MPKKQKEPTHIGTERYQHLQREERVRTVYLRETATQWVEFNGRKRWKKKNGRLIHSRMSYYFGHRPVIKDVRPINERDLTKYYEESLGNARENVSSARDRLNLAIEDRDQASQRISTCQKDLSNACDEEDRLTRKVGELKGQLEDHQ